MTDWFLNIVTIAAITLQLAVAAIFFGAIATVTLVSFSVIPAPF